MHFETQYPVNSLHVHGATLLPITHVIHFKASLQTHLNRFLCRPLCTMHTHHRNVSPCCWYLRQPVPLPPRNQLHDIHGSSLLLVVQIHSSVLFLQTLVESPRVSPRILK